MPRPQIGQGVWVNGRKQPNGKIISIDWEGEEVQAKLYDTDELVVLEFYQLDEFNERLNQWMIHYYGE